MAVAGRACTYHVPYRTKRCTGHGAKMFYRAGVPLAHTLAFARVFPPLWGGLGWGAVAARVGKCKYICCVQKQEPTIGCVVAYLPPALPNRPFNPAAEGCSIIHSIACFFLLSLLRFFLPFYLANKKEERNEVYKKKKSLQ